MLNEVSTSTTIFGLVGFFVVFVAIAIYVYSPKRKKEMKEHGEIPLKESENKESEK